MNDCEYKCCEGKCDRKCGEPCYECKNKCKISCEHSSCQRLCNEICDRIPCDYECEKMLACKHRCLGLCGEVCPKICRKCKPNDETFTIFFGTEDEENARFYALECGHIYEVSGLDKYMGYFYEEEKEEELNKAVQFKDCPRCKKWIMRSNRYQQQIKETLKHVSNVKKKLLKDNSIALETVLELQMEAKGLSNEDKLKPNLWKDVERELNKMIEVAKKKNRKEILRQEYYNFYYLIRFYPEYKKLLEFVGSNEIKNEVNIEIMLFQLQIKNLGSYYLLNKDVDIVDDQWKKVREKLEVLVMFMNLKTLSMQNPQARSGSNAYLREIIKNKFFLPENQMINLRNFCKKFLISKAEQIEVIKALNLPKGHIFTCPNGHYYAIGECGGATEESKCPECKSKIGGSNHALLPGNKHAGDLDGSNYAAFSQEANHVVGFGNLI